MTGESRSTVTDLRGIIPWQERQFLPVSDTAMLLGCSRAKIYQEAGEGKLALVIETAWVQLKALQSWGCPDGPVGFQQASRSPQPSQ
jgi:hypothetical protein